ncbi:calcium-translocating P-type ATPase, SERCA-type [Candidatus Woesearchaeota archaeon]|nr:calcium-translocating P-type ATPase, SERCA-type [Candidatus Woesearchaeota archaeon]
MQPFYQKSIKEVFLDLKTSEKGLTSDEASLRLQKYGPNAIEEVSRITPFKIFLDQFKSPIVWVLLAAIIISAVLQEYIDVGVIAAIVVLNAVLGFVQEYKAEKAIEHLKKLVSLKAKVLRNNKEEEINAVDLVPGDIILLSTGDKVPADARLINTVNLQTQEAALTGESVPVKKKIRIFTQFIDVADRNNMVFSGTVVTGGRAEAVVVDIGMNTEIGKIAHMIQTTESPPTPLQRQLANLSIWLGIIVVVIAILVFGMGVLHGHELLIMFMAALALAVAAIPEGLPAVVTISLALGIQKLTRKNALVRKLPSMETLGACTVICSDKTGTLTHNEMTVKKLFVNDEIINVSGSGYSTEGQFSKDCKKFDLLLKSGVLNNDAVVKKKDGYTEVIGDPTEAALLICAKKAGINTELLRQKAKRVSEIEFTSERKRMTTIHKYDSKRFAYTKGAAEEIIKLCDRVLINGQLKRMSRTCKERILSVNDKFASQALRVLGFAFKQLQAAEAEGNIESNMVFVGLQAMIDPPRQEVKTAIEKCKTAGIRVIMVTGDHIGTAKAIAREIGITGKAIIGADIEKLSDLDDVVEQVGVYARVNPAHKLHIIEALKKKGHIIAMTGDGVNDAPALKKADLGIAMGVTGTDVAKEASDMILGDDNFASIVSAVEQGRVIFDNIKKFVEYLLSSNMGEVLTLLTAVLFGLPLPLIALQLLWINLVTDGAPALALGFEPPEKGIMTRKPRKVQEKIVNFRRGIFIFLIGFIMMAGTLAAFEIAKPNLNLMYAQTVAFTTLMMFQMFNVVNQRSEDKSVFKIGFFKNKWLLWAVLLSVGLQIIVIYVPFLNQLFSTVPLNLFDWARIIGISASVLVFGEIVKFFKV